MAPRASHDVMAAAWCSVKSARAGKVFGIILISHLDRLRQQGSGRIQGRLWRGGPGSMRGRPLGLAALAIQVLSGLWMGWIYLPGFRGLLNPANQIGLPGKL